MIRTSSVSLFMLIVCALIGYIGLSFKDTLIEDRIANEMQQTELRKKITELRDSVDLVWHQELQLICEFKDPKTHDFFVFWKIGDGPSIGYSYATTLAVKKSDLDFVLNATKKHDVEWLFTLQVLWRESRMGTNMNHKVNYDGSKDGGPFGINSRYKPSHKTGNMREDVYDYMVYYDKYISPYPRHEWMVRYQYGDRKATELGLIRGEKN